MRLVVILDSFGMRQTKGLRLPVTDRPQAVVKDAIDIELYNYNDKLPEPGQNRLIPSPGAEVGRKTLIRLGIHTVKTVGSFNHRIHYSGGENLMHNWLE
jgi:hypothetical protein